MRPVRLIGGRPNSRTAAIARRTDLALMSAVTSLSGKRMVSTKRGVPSGTTSPSNSWGPSTTVHLMALALTVALGMGAKTFSAAMWTLVGSGARAGMVAWRRKRLGGNATTGAVWSECHATMVPGRWRAGGVVRGRAAASWRRISSSSGVLISGMVSAVPPATSRACRASAYRANRPH
jgi:hypothetical protein